VLALLFLFVLSPAFVVARSGSGPGGGGEVATVAAVDEGVEPFFAEYCYGCHNASKQKGGLNLKLLQGHASVTSDPNTWENVLGKLRSGEMPPDDEPRPDRTTLSEVERRIDAALADADAHAQPDPGHVTARRLNRTEYNNTVRDLLGVDLQPADEFPQDDSGYGFDNIGDVLSVPPLLMERYMVAAERVARAAIFGPGKVKATLLRCQPKSRSITPQKEVPADYDQTGLAMPNAVHATRRLPVTGTYKVRVYTGGSRPAGALPVTIAFWVDGKTVESATLDPSAVAGFFSDKQDFGGKFREFSVRLTAGEHWLAATIPGLYEGLPASYGGPRPSTAEEPKPREFVPPPDATPKEIEEARKEFEEQHGRVPANDVRISYFEVAGPYDPETGPPAEARKHLYACGHLDGRHTAACPRTILASLARRAYRRPITPSDLSPLLALFKSAHATGTFDDGLALALQAILVSPDFLFRIESPKGPPALTDYELATRLSYFLWASMPDRELRRAAAAGELHTARGLDAQVRRMLLDDRARSLVQEFGGQWLQIRALESSAPDKERFPAFDDYLRISMRRETELFFERIIKEDRSILDFLDAPWTYVNQRLAQHYHIAGVEGPAFRRVDLTGPQRAGVLTQASVLTVSSYATRTSPVLRGKWILENLLNAPPPAPPPGVPNLNEATATAPTSLRQQLEAHRSNAICAACHRRMDPLGFGLENYDAIGAWRDKDGDTAIDASGTLPDGRSFHDGGGLRHILASEREAFTKALTAKLLTYALGRGLGPSDRRIIRTVARELPSSQYRFSALVLAIVRSPQFQLRGGLATP
jgi:hypothetical protein